MRLYQQGSNPTVYVRRNNCSFYIPIIYRRTAKLITPDSIMRSYSFEGSIPSWIASEMRGGSQSVPHIASILAIVRFFIERKKTNWSTFRISTTSFSTALYLKSNHPIDSDKLLFKLEYAPDGVTPSRFIVNERTTLHPQIIKALKALLWYHGISTPIINVILQQLQDNEVVIELDGLIKSLGRPATSYEDNQNEDFIPIDYNDPITFNSQALTVTQITVNDLTSSINDLVMPVLAGGTPDDWAIHPTPVNPFESSAEESLLKWR